MTEKEELEILRKERRLAELEAKHGGSAPADSGDYGALDQLMSHATYGGSDRLKAGAGYLGERAGNIVGDMFGLEQKQEPKSYAEHYKGITQNRDNYREQNPWKAGVAGVGGALVNPVNTKLAEWTTKAGSGLLSQTGKAATAGGTMGGLQAGGEAPTTDAMQAVATGVDAIPLNAAIAAPFPVVFKGLQMAWNKGDDILNRFMDENNQTSTAMRKVVEALKQDHPDKSLDDIHKMILNLGPEGALMDAGPNSRGLLFAVFAKPGETKKKVMDRLIQRQEGVRDANEELIEGSGQIGRIDKGLQKIHPEEFQGKINEEQVTKLYKQAYKDNPSVMSDELDLVLRTPAGKEALKEAVTHMQNRGKNVAFTEPELTALYKDVFGKSAPGGRGVASGMKLETYDKIKQAMDRVIGNLKAGGERFKSQYEDMIHVKGRLVKELDKVTKGDSYQQARGLSSIDFQISDAAKLGEKFMQQGMKKSVVKEAMDNMGPEALHEFRVAVVMAIREKLGGLVVRADATKKIFEIRGMEKKIAQAFGSKSRFKEYIKMLKAEQQMNKTYGIMGGSQTAEREAIKSAADIDPSRIAQSFGDFASKRPIQGTINLFRGVKDKFLNTDATTKEVGDILLGKNVDLLKGTFRRKDFNDRLARRLLGASIKSTTGQ
jgi:hypothetical protein